MNKASPAQIRKEVLERRFAEAEKKNGRPPRWYALICNDCPEEVREPFLPDLIAKTEGWSIGGYRENMDYCPYHRNKRINDIKTMLAPGQ